MEIELILSLLEQAPVLGVLVILYMMNKSNGKNGKTVSGVQTELMRGIGDSLDKLADAQVDANRIAERRARGFEAWLDRNPSCPLGHNEQSPFQSRNPRD